MSALASFFKRGTKTPAELVKSTKQSFAALEDKKEEKMQKKALEKISQNLSSMKFMLYGDGETEAKPDTVQKLCEELLQTDLLLLFLNYMPDLEFEARKDVAQIYNFVLRQQKQAAVDYVTAHPQILETLVKGYSVSDMALNCGSILREAVRHEQLNMLLMNSEHFDMFFEYVQVASFDVSSDAFATFKMMLTKHKPSCAKFLETQFERVFSKYNQLFQSNYVTKRQALKLLGELLLNRANFKVMMRYINDPGNLKIMMNLLRCNSKAIQFEAFHVFKIFVANPKKSKPIVEILLRNKDKLMQFLQKFQKDKEDEQFNEEKSILLQTLERLDSAALAAAPEPEPGSLLPQAVASPSAPASAIPPDAGSDESKAST